MSALTKDQLQDIRLSINAALVAVAKKHSLTTLRAGNCTFNPDGSFRFQLDGTVAGGLDKEASMYEATRKFNEDLPQRGSSFKHQGKTYTITGLKGRKARLELDGKTFYISLDFVIKNPKGAGAA